MIDAFRFLEAVKGDPAPARERIGSVTAVAPVTVLFDGEVTGADEKVAVMQSCCPVVDDRVVCIKIGAKWTAVSVIGGPLVQAGTKTFSFTTQTSSFQSVVFPRAFGRTARVMTQIASNDSSTFGWYSRADSADTIGFDLWVRGTSATWVSIRVDWLASGSL